MTDQSLAGHHGSRQMRLPFLLLIAMALLLAGVQIGHWLPQGLVDYPGSAIIPLSNWVGDNLNWLARQAEIGSMKIQDITRAAASIIEIPISALNIALVKGVTTGTGENVRMLVPPFSWLTILGLICVLAHAAGGARSTLIAAIGLLYLVVFGFWPPAMITLVSVVMATVASVILGILIGAWAYSHHRAASFVEAIMNVMQTVPVFSYLVPTLLFLGYGPSASLVATIIFALPPMVHAATLALRSVPEEIVEYGNMAGASPRQIFWQIKLPAALPMLSVGINQTIMACLNMVIIASMIGAGGLGYLVLLALRRLDIGGALEAGIAIVVLAILLDRISQKAAANSAAGKHLSDRGLRHLIAAITWAIVTTCLALALPFLQAWPKDLTITTAPIWNGLISWINIHLFVPLDAIRSFTLIHLMNPTKVFLLDMPWTLIVTIVGLTAWHLGGHRLALLSIGLALFIAVTGYWDPAMVSVYLVGTGVLISLFIGLPLGYALSRHARVKSTTQFALDTLQTLPTLIYILPAVMVFRNGDFSAVLAIISYAIAPAIRYSMHGFSSVPPERSEAAAMCGATKWQTLKWVNLPSAFPTLILGINQTVMMAISMLVITALVGTRDLGQQVFIALSQAKVGAGIVGGLAVAALALIADCQLKAWAVAESRKMGLQARKN